MQIQGENVELLHKCMTFLNLISPQHYNFVRKQKNINAINLAKSS